MPGRHSRNKGARFEREAVALFQEAGICAERVPLSGAAQGRFGGDISIPIMGEDHRLECKKRADGFKEPYAWIEGNFGVVVAADRKAPLVILRLADFAELVKGWRA